ncbi:multiheme c-type cytochrome [Leptospira interrogans]|uniref:Cytochrome c family protein n=4 Tax=Leptospira interrogans TaxID=173 RepID=A0A067YC90_LEPIR|nr:multiheme c-type cytochrome [Leptospira interrogans]AGZ85007.1 cytochrome c family protein [Leptospira interrogans serovar Canicola]EKN89781.1 cytochrome c554 and C-prime [Leptospira interrogans str. 2002000624]EKO68793.1 cytochrome c554 and C-prime [Leptospira interrogans serovar Canicola str. Fiocruz LV133]EKQ39833.1 cytochrome c554 and C-prime [Leptospira interrogans str. 2002000621]EKQ47328.1 cytochrome c554 and C-prime [Leptospira interrogans str. 2002000623]
MRIIILLSLILLFHCSEDKTLAKIFRFSNGIHPVYFDQQSDLAKNLKDNTTFKGSESCKSCHKIIFENWQKSMHRQSFTNSFYQESHAKEPMSWCLNCHSPLLSKGENEKDHRKRILKEEGVSCIVCHVREEKILVAKKPEFNSLVHEYLETPILKSSEFCASCHQFNFPANKSLTEAMHKEFKYSNLPMQNTYNEWKQSIWDDKKNCQSCHLFPKTKRSHSFPGGHDLNYLSDAFNVQLQRISQREFVLIVSLNKTGHAFPTGDLFRALRIHVLNDKDQLIKEWTLKKTYTLSLDKSPESSPKSLINDFVFQPQADKKKPSAQQFHFTLTKESTFLKYRLYIDYLNGFSHAFGKIPLENSILLFKKGMLEVVPVEADQG